MGLGGEVGDDAVVEDGGGDRFEVFEGGHVVSAESGAGFRTEDEVLDGTRACAPADGVLDPLRRLGLSRPGLADDFHGVVVEVVRDGHAADELLESDDLLAVDEFGKRLLRGSSGFAGDLFLLFGGWVFHLDEKHEAVELSFGQRIGSLLLDRVLGGEDKERGFEGVGLSQDSDFLLTHRFEHGGLGLGWGAVDLVGEDEVCEYRAFDELELAFPTDAGFLDDIRAGDIGGHQIRGELDTIEGEVEGLGDGGDEEGFRETGDAHEQGVATCEQADCEFFDDFILSDDGFCDFFAESLVCLAELVDGGNVVGWKLVWVAVCNGFPKRVDFDFGGDFFWGF